MLNIEFYKYKNLAFYPVDGTQDILVYYFLTPTSKVLADVIFNQTIVEWLFSEYKPNEINKLLFDFVKNK